MIHRSAAATSFLAAGLLLLAGCSATEPPTETREAGSPEAAALLPAEIAESGVVKVASDAHYAPMDFFEEDGTTLTGADYEMGQAIAEALGVTFEVSDVSFDNIIPSLKSGQYDVAVTFMTDTVERQAEVDFVDAYQSGSSILVLKGNPEGISELTDLCGLTVVTTATSVQNELAAQQDAECAALGEDPINVINVTTDTEALLALKSGQAVADLAESVAANYNASTSGNGNDFEVVGPVYAPSLVGITFPKDSPLIPAVETALTYLIDQGIYQSILDKWGLSQLAIEDVTVNGAK